MKLHKLLALTFSSGVLLVLPSTTHSTITVSSFSFRRSHVLRKTG